MNNCKICEVIDKVETSLPCPDCYEGVMYVKVYNLFFEIKSIRYDKRQCLETGKMYWQESNDVITYSFPPS